MKLWPAVRNAVRGWIMILRGDAGWRGAFSLTMPGLVTALIIFFFCAFLAIVLASISSAMPDIFGIMDLLLVHGIWITALFVTIRVTIMTLKSPLKTRELLVPGVYLLVAYLLVGSLLNLVFSPLVQIATIALLYPLYRLGRVAGGWNVGISASFAAATVLLLVGVPQALYMLSNFAL